MLRVKLVKAYKINCQILSAINYSITNNRNCDLHKLTYIRFIKNASIQIGMWWCKIYYIRRYVNTTKNTQLRKSCTSDSHIPKIFRNFYFSYHALFKCICSSKAFWRILIHDFKCISSSIYCYTIFLVTFKETGKKSSTVHGLILQLTFSCSKWTIETLEKDVKCVNS